MFNIDISSMFISVFIRVWEIQKVDDEFLQTIVCRINPFDACSPSIFVHFRIRWFDLRVADPETNESRHALVEPRPELLGCNTIGTSKFEDAQTFGFILCEPIEVQNGTPSAQIELCQVVNREDGSKRNKPGPIQFQPCQSRAYQHRLPQLHFIGWN